MSSPSRAWVHSACTVYIALPSACSETTFRSGQATAAPVASGGPSPIDPPMLESQSCGAAIRVGAKNPRPVVVAQHLERQHQILLRPRQHMALAALRREAARLVRVGEKRDRHLGAD